MNKNNPESSFNENRTYERVYGDVYTDGTDYYVKNSAGIYRKASIEDLIDAKLISRQVYDYILAIEGRSGVNTNKNNEKEDTLTYIINELNAILENLKNGLISSNHAIELLKLNESLIKKHFKNEEVVRLLNEIRSFLPRKK